MFDIGWSEMAVIMLVALIVIGPKDLPRVARTVGQWVRKGRSLAREFQRSLEDMAREAELDQVKKDIEEISRTDLSKTIERTVDPKGELSRAFDPTSRPASAKPATPLPGSAGAPAATPSAPPAPPANGAAQPPAAAVPAPAAPAAAAPAADANGQARSPAPADPA
jgi:sec-independent protein translocase protein TatB